jgi:hypothetical protein
MKPAIQGRVEQPRNRPFNRFQKENGLNDSQVIEKMERETGIEPATFSLGS